VAVFFGPFFFAIEKERTTPCFVKNKKHSVREKKKGRKKERTESLLLCKYQLYGFNEQLLDFLPNKKNSSKKFNKNTFNPVYIYRNILEAQNGSYRF